MRETYGKVLRAAIGAALIFESAACGTIMYPERRGQRGGRIDAGVAVLDAVGLLFFIIPGVIAFAVDFSNGTIYFPGGGKSVLGRDEPIRVRFDPRGDAKAAVEKIVGERTGAAIRLDRDAARIIRPDSEDELPALFAMASASELVAERR